MLSENILWSRHLNPITSRIEKQHTFLLPLFIAVAIFAVAILALVIFG